MKQRSRPICDAASEMLKRYFNTRDAGVAAALKEIKRLSGLQVAQKLPGHRCQPRRP
jgi:uncharacterized protein HemX